MDVVCVSFTLHERRSEKRRKERIVLQDMLFLVFEE
jgi:hypothetical protein